MSRGYLQQFNPNQLRSEIPGNRVTRIEDINSPEQIMGRWAGHKIG